MVKNTAIILAAGNSSRFESKINKNLMKINKKEIILYSIEAFIKNKNIDEILIAIRKKDESIIKKIINNQGYINKKKIELIIGGKDRKESVYNCLLKANGKIVIIHDSARPNIKQAYISKCIKSIEKYDGVTIGVKSKDTIKVSNKKNIVEYTTNRDNTWIIQTPQCFRKDTLLKCHENTIEHTTDDCMLLEMNNYKVKIIKGYYDNIKITTKGDEKIMKIFLK